MKYELSMKIEGDEIISGIRINFIGKNGKEIIIDKEDSILNGDNGKKSRGKSKSSKVITNKSEEIPPEMDVVF